MFSDEILKGLAEGLKYQGANHWEIISDSFERPRILVIVESQEDKAFAENYLYENLPASRFYEVKIRGAK